MDSKKIEEFKEELDALLMKYNAHIFHSCRMTHQGMEDEEMIVADRDTHEILFKESGSFYDVPLEKLLEKRNAK